jgi:putative transposase
VLGGDRADHPISCEACTGTWHCRLSAGRIRSIDPTGCSCIGLQKSSYFYKPRRSSQAALKQRIKEISETRVRYGYRRIHVLLRREGWEVNVKRVYRLYTELGLQIRNKRPKRKVSAKLREDRRPPEGPNDVWAMDFLSDQLFDGRKIRVLTIVDAFSKIAPAVDVRQRYTGADVVATLERVTAHIRLAGQHSCR